MPPSIGRVGRWLRNPWLQLTLLLTIVTLSLQAWQGQREQALGERIAAAAAPGDLRMLSSTTCGICTQARQWFRGHATPSVAPSSRRCARRARR